MHYYTQNCYSAASDASIHISSIFLQYCTILLFFFFVNMSPIRWFKESSL